MYWYAMRPKDVESKYELMVFEGEEPFLPLTDYYDDCLRRISKGSAKTYLKCLLPFFKWLTLKSNFKGEQAYWNDEPLIVPLAL